MILNPPMDMADHKKRICFRFLMILNPPIDMADHEKRIYYQFLMILNPPMDVADRIKRIYFRFFHDFKSFSGHGGWYKMGFVFKLFRRLQGFY
jgi:hypothetical protein